MRIALYKDIKYDYTTVAKESMFLDDKTFVRVSEVVEVDFPALSDEETIHKQLAALDEVRAEVSIKFAQALKEIDDRKASLQALTYQSA